MLHEEKVIRNVKFTRLLLLGINKFGSSCDKAEFIVALMHDSIATNYIGN